MSEEVVVPEVENDDDFNSGFDESAAPTETPVTEEAQPEVEEAPEVEEPTPEPEYVSLTKQEVEELKTRAAMIDEIKETQTKQLDKAFGKIGGIERLIQGLQSQTPAGVKVEVTDDLVSEMAAEYPELGAMQLNILKKFAEKITGVGTGPAVAPSIDEDAIVTKAASRLALETLDSTHENWREVVGLPDASGNIPETEYRKWLKTKDAAYQDRVNNAYSPTVIGKSIDEFNAEKAKAKVQADSRRTRIASGVTPKGTGGSAPARTDDDDFEAGFNGV